MGPTASGKTNLAIEFIQQFPAEIISVDSAMIYREMNIGTAKPAPELLKQAPHRLIDLRDPSQNYSVGEFRKDSLAAIKAILEKKRIPILVGGTMLYFHVLQYGIASLPKANPEIRQQLQQALEKQGQQMLHAELQRIDPIAAQRIHPNDPQRLLRALEVAAITGKTLTEIRSTQSITPLPYHFINIALIPQDRNHHHRLIEKRFQAMLKQGFIEEVEKLFKRTDLNADLPSIRTVGYRQIWQYLEGKLSYPAMQERAVIATRQLAKRQMTWLRSWKNLYSLNYEEKNIHHQFAALIKNFRISDTR
jgi:tRNA dimethylallyltransferase